MKIVSAKINCEPKHAITSKEIKKLFSLVPEDWKLSISTVVLSAELFANSRFDRPVICSLYSSRLNILSRGFSKERIVKEILIELAINGGEAQAVQYNRIPRGEMAKIDKIVDPLVAKFFSSEI